MASSISTHERRKEAHLRICLDYVVQASNVSTGFEHFRLEHQALPGIDWEEIDTSVYLFGKKLSAPIVISPMTGGCSLGARINRNLAQAAHRLGLAMGIGSQRVAILHPELEDSFRVRDVAPDILLFGNLGAVQLNAGFGLDECRRAVDMIGADALCLHLNAMQEIHQRGGDLKFRGVLERISEVCSELRSPVMVKEVGWGISKDAARALVASGVDAIDVSGAGGTSWFVVEQLSKGIEQEEVLRSPFASWGIPTAESLRQVVEVAGNLPVIASGGIRNGVDAAKALAMGASAVGVALPLLKPAAESAKAVVDVLERLIQELRIAMFGIGAVDISSLRRTRHLVKIT
ncbi:MAG: type 2 isopentenyl-diphosphate Delta-isomerase [Chloroflexota bacterium]|jgi:isopentenyl-diphosphate delta-isomerase